MQRFSLCFHDRAGRVLTKTAFEAADVYRALAHANTKLQSALRQRRGHVDERGRVDVREPDGAVVARISCADMIIGMA